MTSQLAVAASINLKVQSSNSDLSAAASANGRLGLRVGPAGRPATKAVTGLRRRHSRIFFGPHDSDAFSHGYSRISAAWESRALGLGSAPWPRPLRH